MINRCDVDGQQVSAAPGAQCGHDARSLRQSGGLGTRTELVAWAAVPLEDESAVREAVVHVSQWLCGSAVGMKDAEMVADARGHAGVPRLAYLASMDCSQSCVSLGTLSAFAERMVVGVSPVGTATLVPLLRDLFSMASTYSRVTLRLRQRPDGGQWALLWRIANTVATHPWSTPTSGVAVMYDAGNWIAHASLAGPCDEAMSPDCVAFVLGPHAANNLTVVVEVSAVPVGTSVGRHSPRTIFDNQTAQEQPSQISSSGHSSHGAN